MTALLDRPPTAPPLMDRVPIDPAPRRDPVLLRAVRSMGVSVATTLLSLTILGSLTLWGVDAALANVIATVAGIGPSYSWNRRYAWRLDGRGRAAEAVPFWTMCLLGLVASTLAVSRADAAVRAAGWHGMAASAAVLGANLATFGSLWVVQFLVLDRFLFAPARRTD